ncbi:hypothetical protein HK099_001991, partial [Clydaea vesicula]
MGHAILGSVLIIAVFFQAAFGGFTRLGMIREDIRSYKLLKFIHRYNGLAIVTAAIVQVGLGLYILYPYYESRGLEFWILYIAVAGFWVILFFVSEIYYIKNIVGNTVSNEENKKLLGKGEKIPASRLNDLVKYQDKNNLDSEEKVLYTWQEIDEEVKNGRILVVSNGKYIYDASQWITSHPGGKLILYSVAGTDISLDYFYEAGFDASQFAPKQIAPKHRDDRGNIPQSTSLSRPQQAQRRLTLENFKQPIVNLSEKDWALVVRSRRTHIHTKLALERLSLLQVGELKREVDDGYSSNRTLATNGSLIFNPYEYRRYGMTEKVLLTDDGKSNFIFWKLKFTLLYPYDYRENQPTTFSNGEAIQIQVRLPSGKVIDRYYTAISGNIACFDILVKVKVNGEMTPFLNKCRPGERQFKIRGPFGTSLVKAPNQPDNYMPNTLVYIAAGSGLTPFLQILNTMILPLYEPLEVWEAFTPANSDEVPLNAGDYVVSYVITTTRFGRNFKMILINCIQSTSDIVGLELLDAAMITYPNQIEVHHLVSDFDRGIRDGVSGYIRDGKINEVILGEILSSVNN